ncbi:MAG: hypothetical protein U0163_04795 [Gemmatimonadaceae bacterium]
MALEYHDVVSGERFEESGFSGAAARTYKMTDVRFDAHCAAVAADGVAIVSDIRQPTSAQRVALFTFDDGGASALDPADILERFGWRGHFFVTTGAIQEPPGSSTEPMPVHCTSVVT